MVRRAMSTNAKPAKITPADGKPSSSPSRSIFRTGLPSAGVFAGPLAWFVGLTAKYAAVPWVCAHKFQLVHPMTLVALAIALAGAWFSWRAISGWPAEPPPDSTGAGRPHHFVAVMSALVAILFAAVIVLQGAAAFVLNGCER